MAFYRGTWLAAAWLVGGLVLDWQSSEDSLSKLENKGEYELEEGANRLGSVHDEPKGQDDYGAKDHLLIADHSGDSDNRFE